MGKSANYFKIGLFAIAALTALTAATLYFGLSSALRPTLMCETYFDHSVQGLSVGGAVNFRGMRAGQISGIDVPPAQPGAPGRRAVRVRYFIRPDLVTGVPGASVEEARQMVEGEIARDLRCSLSFQGVSGLGYLDLDYVAPSSESASWEGMGPSDPGIVVIPGAQGSMMAIGEAVGSILESLRRVDFEGLNHSLQATLSGMLTLTHTIDSEIVATSAAMGSALASISGSVQGLGELTDKVSKEVDNLDLAATNRDIQASLAQFRRAMGQAEDLFRAPRSSLPQTMENLRVMSENLRDLSEMAKRYPSQVLFGRPPEEPKAR